ncbi:MAG: ribosomal protein S18-alanine N-acetyltransferase [Coxiellaceae bacterium]|nr:ribosomal protein S18-alanine N-acetyltransferase [Coxiellaceae bacterium]
MTTTTQIRVYHPDDAAAMAAIANVAKHYPWSKQVFRDCMVAQYPGWVLCEDEQVRGFSIIKVVAEEAELLNLCVDPAVHRQGYGRRLLQYAIDEAQKHFAEHIYLEVRKSNKAAKGLYHHMGFSEVGIRKQYYPTDDGREDAVIMFRAITKLR